MPKEIDGNGIQWIVRLNEVNSRGCQGCPKILEYFLSAKLVLIWDRNEAKLKSTIDWPSSVNLPLKMDRKGEGEDPLYGYKREDYKVSASVSSSSCNVWRLLFQLCAIFFLIMERVPKEKNMVE